MEYEREGKCNGWPYLLKEEQRLFIVQGEKLVVRGNTCDPNWRQVWWHHTYDGMVWWANRRTGILANFLPAHKAIPVQDRRAGTIPVPSKRSLMCHSAHTGDIRWRQTFPVGETGTADFARTPQTAIFSKELNFDKVLKLCIRWNQFVGKMTTNRNPTKKR
jgi:hypothetical protein